MITDNRPTNSTTMKRYRQAIDSKNSIKLRQQALDSYSAKNYMTIQEPTYRKNPLTTGVMAMEPEEVRFWLQY